jgi:hypothetical protein
MKAHEMIHLLSQGDPEADVFVAIGIPEGAIPCRVVDVGFDQQGAVYIGYDDEELQPAYPSVEVQGQKLIACETCGKEVNLILDGTMKVFEAYAGWGIIAGRLHCPECLINSAGKE